MVERRAAPVPSVMIRLEYRPLADGLRAHLRRDGTDLVITVNTDARPAAQRSAVRKAIAAARRAGWTAPRVRAGILAAGTSALVWRQLRGAVTAHLAAAAAGTAVVGTSALVAATMITVAPSPAPPGFAAPRPSASTSHHRRRRAARIRGPRPGTGATPWQPAGPRGHHHPQPKGHRSRTPGPSPGPGPSSPSPQPPGSGSPSPSPSPSPRASSGKCVVILGIEVCL